MIADGLKGHDEALVPVRNGEYVKEAKIGRAVMDADIVISLSHMYAPFRLAFLCIFCVESKKAARMSSIENAKSENCTFSLFVFFYSLFNCHNE